MHCMKKVSCQVLVVLRIRCLLCRINSLLCRINSLLCRHCHLQKLCEASSAPYWGEDTKGTFVRMFFLLHT